MKSVFHDLLQRELGALRPEVQIRNNFYRFLEDFDLSDEKEFKSPHKAGVTCLGMEAVEGRFLLSGGLDGKLSLFDTARPLRSSQASTMISPIMEDKWRGRTRYELRAVEWYPFDTGLFVTGGRDCKVKVWDTNCLKVEHCFNFESPVNCCHMSPIARQHSLIATATNSNQARLCDLVTGGTSQTLIGHQAEVLCVRWSPTNEYIIATGSADMSIRLWDIRRPGALVVFDQHNNVDPFVNRRALSAKDKKRADDIASHGGAITCLRFSHDGAFLYSSGTDARVRKWDMHTAKNTLVNYAGTANHSRRIFFDVSRDDRFLFYPNGNQVYIYNNHTGRLFKSLQGAHFDHINGVLKHPHFPELYSAGQDSSLVAWAAPLHAHLDEEGDGDAWSDYDDDDEKSNDDDEKSNDDEEKSDG